MNAEIWAAVGTTIAMLVFFIVPGLVYTWYALESMIGDRESYASVIAQTDDVPVRNGRERGRPGGDRNDDEDRRTVTPAASPSCP